ncbi:helix-turn-helix domain-containing protein, partial [bacterium]
MGVIHKLRPEIKQSIIDEKKANPAISCRSLSYLILQRFNIEVSKSSINSVFKEAGLSMPAARVSKQEVIKPEPAKPEIPIPEVVKPPEPLPPEKPPEKPPEELPKIQPISQPEVQLPSEMPCTGAILLKAADFLLGGSQRITELIKNSLNIDNEEIGAKTEALIYLPFFQAPQEGQAGALQALIGRGISFDDILSYHNGLQSVTSLGTGISQIIGDISKEARCIKVDFSTKDSLYIDGQMYSIWSTPHTPYDFSTTICNADSYINRYF